MAHRRLIPLLAVLLVIQGLVAVVPHRHDSCEAEGSALQATSSVDAVHGCLACSVFAPVVEQASESGVASGLVIAAVVAIDRGSSGAFSVSSSSNPRGPPRVV